MCDPFLGVEDGVGWRRKFNCVRIIRMYDWIFIASTTGSENGWFFFVPNFEWFLGFVGIPWGREWVTQPWGLRMGWADAEKLGFVQM